MAGITGVTRASATLTQLNYKDPKRFEAATLVEIAEIGRQQEVTNEILTLNTRVACENNQLLRGILGAMESLALSDQRERLLKELLYQVNKFLNTDTEVAAEPVELALRARLFLHAVRDHQLSTADLADMSEKQLFDSITARASKAIAGSATKTLEDFELAYGMFRALKFSDPMAGHPKPDVPACPAEPALPPEPVLRPEPTKPELPEPSKPFMREDFDQNVAAELRVLKWASICGCGLAVFAILLLRYTTQRLVGGLCCATALFLIVGCVASYPRLRRLKRSPAEYEKQRLAHEKKKREYDAEVVKWTAEMQAKTAAYEVEKAKWLAESGGIQREYEATISRIREKWADTQQEHMRTVREHEQSWSQQKQEVRARHKALLDHMCMEINSFLDHHPGLQEFLPKVASVAIKTKPTALSPDTTLQDYAKHLRDQFDLDKASECPVCKQDMKAHELLLHLNQNHSQEVDAPLRDYGVTLPNQSS
jgi:hypothetical protein